MAYILNKADAQTNYTAKQNQHVPVHRITKVIILELDLGT